MRGSLAAAVLLIAAWFSTGPAAAQEGPRFSVTEANLLSTFGAPGQEDPFWVLTLQHFSTWRYGSHFFFLDVVDPPGLDVYEDTPGLYVEYAPVVSLRALGALPWDGAPLRDVGLTAQITGGWTPDGLPISRVFLEGVELAWSVPGFAVFNTQLLARQEEGWDPTWQATWVYTLPFAVAGSPALITGYLDVWRRHQEGRESATVVLAQPQLLVQLVGGEGSALQIGVELQPSHDFPVRVPGVLEGWDLAVSPMLRWVF